MAKVCKRSRNGIFLFFFLKILFIRYQKTRLEDKKFFYHLFIDILIKFLMLPIFWAIKLYNKTLWETLNGFQLEFLYSFITNGYTVVWVKCCVVRNWEWFNNHENKRRAHSFAAPPGLFHVQLNVGDFTQERKKCVDQGGFVIFLVFVVNNSQMNSSNQRNLFHSHNNTNKIYYTDMHTNV